MRINRILELAVASFMLAGCAMVPEDYTGQAGIPPGSGVAVLRVESTFFGRSMYDMNSEPRLGVSTVEIHDGHARSSSLGEVFGRVADSYVYIVLPATHPGQRYVATTYQLNANPSSSRRSLACEGHSAPSFEVKAGAITYVGDYKISDLHRIDAYRIAFQDGFGRDLERARKETSSLRPEFKDMVPALVEPVVLDFGLNCDARKL